MKEIKVTNLAKFCTLMLLYEKPRHGYEIIKESEKKLDKKISASQIYPFLSQLEKNKYIKSKKPGSREKRTFMLTLKGKKFVTDMFSRFGRLFDVAIEPNLSVCAHCGCEVYKGSFRKKTKGKEVAFCCKYCAASF